MKYKTNWKPIVGSLDELPVLRSATTLSGVVESASRTGSLVVLLDDGSKVGVSGGKYAQKGQRVILTDGADGGYVVA